MERIGPYEIEAELGRGGAGVVYRAHDPRTGRDVALKRLSLGGPPNALRRFQREAEALARIRHPHVVAIHDAAIDQRGVPPYLVMDFVPGESLDERLRAGPLPIDEAIRLTIGLADGLAAVHAEGIVHRDVKPANVLLDPDGQPHLTDFGLARQVDPTVDASRLSQTGAFLGTPGYWSPEQASGRLDGVDARADLYGLGATLFHMLTGEPPQGGTLMQILDQLAAPPPRPRALRADVPPGLDALVVRCLAREPDARYPSASALADALRAGALDLAPRSRRTGWALLAGACLVVALPAALATTTARTSGAPETPTASATQPPTATPASAADPEARWSRALEGPPLARYLALRAFCADFPAASRAAEARTRLETLTAAPLLSVRCGPREHHVVAVYGGDAVITRHNRGDSISGWSLTGERRWEHTHQGGEFRLGEHPRGVVWWYPHHDLPSQTKLGDAPPTPWLATHRPDALAVSPSGDLVGLVTADRVLVLNASGHELAAWPATTGERQIAFSPDGARLVVTFATRRDMLRVYTEVRTYDVERGDALGTVRLPNLKPDALAVTPRWTFLGFESGLITRLDATGEEVFTFPPVVDDAAEIVLQASQATLPAGVGGLLVLPGERLLAGTLVSRARAGRSVPMLTLLTANGEKLRHLEVEESTYCLTTAGDGLVLRGTTDGTWELWGDPGAGSLATPSSGER